MVLTKFWVFLNFENVFINYVLSSSRGEMSIWNLWADRLRNEETKASPPGPILSESDDSLLESAARIGAPWNEALAKKWQCLMIILKANIFSKLLKLCLRSSYLDGLDDEDGGWVGVVVEDWATSTLDGGCLRRIDEGDEEDEAELRVWTGREESVKGQTRSWLTRRRNVSIFFMSPARSTPDVEAPPLSGPDSAAAAVSCFCCSTRLKRLAWWCCDGR